MSCRSEDLLKLYKRRRAEGYDLRREAAPDYYAWLDELQKYSSSSASQSAGGTSAPDADEVASSCAVGDDVDPGGSYGIEREPRFSAHLGQGTFRCGRHPCSDSE